MWNSQVELHRLETPNNVGGVGSQCTSNSSYVTVTVVEQIRHIGAAAAGICFGKRRNTLSTHQDFMPEPHTRTFQDNFKRSSKKDLRYRGSHTIFVQEFPRT